MPKTKKSLGQEGIFITFEGSEGSGKSTQIEYLAKHLEAQFPNKISLTREPGGTPLGEEIRHLLKHFDSANPMCPETELLLFEASRAQLTRKVIQPALNEGKIVLCDRFHDSTTVYQGAGRRLPHDIVQSLNTFAIGDLLPDLTVIVNIPADVGIQRAQARTDTPPDRMESERLDFYERICTGYLELARTTPDRFFIVDGTLERALIKDRILNEVTRRFT